MQNIDKTLCTSNVEMSCFPDCDDETEQFVVFELVIPIAAKVPAPRQRLEVTKLVVRPTSVTSTVPAQLVTQLRVNNTALNMAWCTTATLAASSPACLPARY